MSKFVMAGMPAPGHVNPSLPLVRELVTRGVAVAYYTTEQFRPAVERAGAEFHAYPDGVLTSQDIAEATRSGSTLRVVARLLRATGVLVPFLVDELRHTPPDAVGFDSNAIWGYMAAASLDLPKVSFMTTMMVGAGDMKVLTAREWVHTARAMLPDLPAAVRARREVVRRLGKETYPPSPTLPMRGDVTIFPIPRALQAPNPLVDERCHFVGPAFTDRGDDLDPELAAHTGGPEPVVLVSLGTLHGGTADFFRTCFQVLADLPVRAVVVTGHHAGDPGPAPANVLVRESVPQPELLRHAAVFVTHGGMNSVMEGLNCGVPLVVVPQQVEQLLIGRAVADRGAGFVLRHNLSHRAVPAAELRTAVTDALHDPAVRTAARALGDELTAGGGAAAAADVVLDVLRSRRVAAAGGGGEHGEDDSAERRNRRAPRSDR
ncbi:macrolide family glycosyltransferase [Saccharothrix obliqua]|uniref:macrolide family glycosyltransferase n=1 Tax=Saccharothrix obliqua TaxID=2861747 RepID=UPI002151ABA8|nr:macrolide family glycosyltransferase [Saccharothrix obliqua]